MKYISVTKPGILVGNIITMLGAFFFAAQQNSWHLLLLISTLVGMSFVMASGCVFNNIIDRDIDRLMERTKNRVTAQGLISLQAALIYAVILGILGLIILYYEANPLTALIALSGFLVYVVAYTIFGKRRSAFGTAIGAISGAIPPVVGYCAVTSRFDLGAILLFLILFFWQMPHFYAIAIYRYNDYLAASIPVLPVRKNIPATKISMILYVMAFTITAILPTIFGYTGLFYLFAALMLGLVWLYYAFQGLKTDNDQLWARKMFLISIIDITFLSILLAIHLP